MDQKAYLEEVKHRGYVRGRCMAAAQEFALMGSMQRWPDELRPRRVEGIDDQHDLMCAWAYASESANRDFSPFEFTAHEFNSRDDADEVWAAFGAGIDQGIHEEVVARFAVRRARWEAAYADVVVVDDDTPPPDPREVARKHGLTEDETEHLVELCNDACGCPTGRI